MVSFNKLTRTLAGIAAAALIVPLAACGGSGNGGTATAEGIPAKGTDDGTEITLWTRSPLERQAKNVVEAYNKSHKNQVKLEIIPNDDMEGKVGGASQTDSLPDILAGDVVRIPYWASEGIFTDITKQIDGLDNKADLQQGHIEAGTVDGTEYTLPFITDVSVMVWNKALYKEAGLDPEQGPKSIAEFTEQAKKVAALNKDGVAGSYLAGQSGGALVFDLFPSVWADGESVMNKDGSEATLDNDSMKGVLDATRNWPTPPTVWAQAPRKRPVPLGPLRSRTARSVSCLTRTPPPLLCSMLRRTEASRSASLRSRAPRKARPPRSSVAMPWVSPRTPSTLLRPGTSSTG